MHDRTKSLRRAAVVLAAALVLSSCSGSSDGASDGAADDGPTTTAAPAATTTTTVAPATEPYVGDDFYAVPDPLPAGPHGTLLRFQEAEDYQAEGTTAYRILYLSTSVAGDPVAVSGIATVPTEAAPADGRKLLTISHGTSGIADECAPSKHPLKTELTLARSALGRQFLLAMTDYEGLGTPGRHPYLVGVSEGRSTLDAIVAAGQLPDADPGGQLAIAGYSQGGHGALWAAQLAPEWVPDLDLVGTFAGAPASEIDIILAAAPRLPVAGFAYMVVAGFDAAYPEADPDLFLTDEGVGRLDEVDRGCVRDVIQSFAGTPADELIRPGGPGTEPWKQLAIDNDAATEKTGDAPTLVIHSQEDSTVPIVFSKILLDRMCGQGQVVERRILPTGSHGSAALPAYDQAFAWLRDRFDPAAPAATSSCP